MTYACGNKRTRAKNVVDVRAPDIHPLFIYPFSDQLYITPERLVIDALFIFAHLHVQFSAKIGNLILLDET
jgi:hypothetical protein